MAAFHTIVPLCLIGLHYSHIYVANGPCLPCNMMLSIYGIRATVDRVSYGNLLIHTNSYAT